MTSTGDPFRPAVFRLHPAAPNPFRADTRIAFDLPTDSAVTLEIYDIRGRRVRVLERSRLAAGTHETAWNGRDDAGRSVAAGVYLVRLRSDGFQGTQRVVLVR